MLLTSSSVRWIASGLLLLALVAATHGGTCDYETQTEKALFETPSGRFTYRGASIMVKPWRTIGKPDPDLALTVNMSRIAELRAPTDPFERRCGVPGLPSFPVDRETDVARELLLKECNCADRRRVVTIMPNVTEEQVVLEVDCSNAVEPISGLSGVFKDFKLQIILKRPNNNYSIPFGPEITSQNETVYFAYNKNDVSFSMEMQDWPWLPGPVVGNESYVLAEFQLIPEVRTEGVVGDGSDGKVGSIYLKTKYAETAIRASHSYLLDGIPYLPRLTPYNLTDQLTLNFDIVDGFSVPFRQQFCSEVLIYETPWGIPNVVTENLKWKNASYDPTFVTLFTAEDPRKPTTAAAKKNQRNLGIAVGVSVAVVVVIIIIVVSVPVVKHVIRPYSKRRDAKKEAPLSSSGPPASWSGGRKPTTIN